MRECTITGFRIDADGHWVAELECGHAQHVRHDPPLAEREWVLSQEGRASRVGTALPCPTCESADFADPEGRHPG